MKILRNVSLISVFFLLSGCASKNCDVHSYAKSSWHSAIDAVQASVAEDKDSSTEEGDGTSAILKDEKGAYTLPALLELGIRNNSQTRVAWWQAKKVFAQSERAKMGFYPSVTVNLNVNRSQTGSVSKQKSMQVDNWGPGLKITYRIFQFGATEAAARHAACLLAAANYDFNYVLQTLVFQIQKFYCNYVSVVAAIQARKISLEDAEVSLNAVEQRLKNGLARTQDFLLARAEKIRAIYELQMEQSNLERCRAELALVVGIPVSKDFEIATEFHDTVNMEEQKRLLQSLEDAMKLQESLQRADILAKEKMLQAAEWAQKKTQKENLPALDMIGTINALRYKHDPHWQRNYTLGVSLSWSLFDGFDKQYKNLECYAATKLQQANLQQQKLKMFRDVWVEFHALRSLLQLFASAKELEIASQEALEAIRVGYNTGLNSLLDLLSAQKNLSEARLKRINSQMALRVQWVQLAYVSGRLTPNPLPN